MTRGNDISVSIRLCFTISNQGGEGGAITSANDRASIFFGLGAAPDTVSIIIKVFLLYHLILIV